jgi:hypothetical protein
MTTFEKLSMVASGTGEVWEKARAMIGVSELALLLAQEAVKNTTAEELSPTKVASATGLTDRAARNRIFNTAIQERERSKSPALQ